MTNDMTNGSPIKLILSFMVPLLIGNIFQQFYNMADTIIVVVGIATGGKISGFTLASIALLIYMAMISAVAYTLWGILLKYNPVGKVAVFGFTNPIFGVILSAVFLGEKNQAFGVQGLVALVLVSVGIFMVNKSKN